MPNISRLQELYTVEENRFSTRSDICLSFDWKLVLDSIK